MSTPTDPPPARDVKPPSTIVYCKLPSGGTITTTLSHCDVLGGEVVGKEAAPQNAVLVACRLGNGKTVSTLAADCTQKLYGAVEGEVP